MAIIVGSSGVTVKTIRVVGSTTIVKKIVVGTPVATTIKQVVMPTSPQITVAAGNATQVKRVVTGTPVRRIKEGTFVIHVDDVRGVDTSGATNGSLLIYNSSTEKWTASKELEEQNINGGSY